MGFLKRGRPFRECSPFHCSTGWNTLAWKARDAIGNEVSSRLNNPRCVLREINTRGGWNFAQQIYRRPCGFTVCDSRSPATHDRPARNIVMVSGRRLRLDLSAELFCINFILRVTRSLVLRVPLAWNQISEISSYMCRRLSAWTFVSLVEIGTN